MTLDRGPNDFVYFALHVDVHFAFALVAVDLFDAIAVIDAETEPAHGGALEVARFPLGAVVPEQGNFLFITKSAEASFREGEGFGI